MSKRSKKIVARFSVCLVALALAVSTVPVPPTAHAQNLITSTASLPFTGAVFDSVTGETVNISGSLHVVTQVTTATLTVFTNVANVNAIGLSSGGRYILNGAQQMQFAFSPSSASPTLSPIQTLDNNALTILEPVVQSRTCTICRDHVFLHYTLSFASDGALLAGSSSVVLCGESSCCNIGTIG